MKKFQPDSCMRKIRAYAFLRMLTHPHRWKNFAGLHRIICKWEQRETEQEYYQGVAGFQGEFLYAENFGSAVSRIPLFRGNSQIPRNYCAFWKKDNWYKRT